MKSNSQSRRSLAHRAPERVRPATTGLVLGWEQLREVLVTSVDRVRPTVTMVLLLFVFLFGYLYTLHDMRFFVVDSSSMAPTLHARDYIVTSVSKAYRRGDIVVFSDSRNSGDFLAKRIVAVAGDRVEIAGFGLVVNGQAVAETYLPERMEFLMLGYVVPPGEVFVLGDNRNESDDSQNWRRGIPVSNIRGKVRGIYLPLHHFGRIKEVRTAFAGV